MSKPDDFSGGYFNKWPENVKVPPREIPDRGYIVLKPKEPKT